MFMYAIVAHETVLREAQLSRPLRTRLQWRVYHQEELPKAGDTQF